jgi:hypothetical protein
MFAPAYMGRKRCFPMLFIPWKTILALGCRPSPQNRCMEGATPPSFSVHVRCGEHGAPVQNNGLSLLLLEHLLDASQRLAGRYIEFLG